MSSVSGSFFEQNVFTHSPCHVKRPQLLSANSSHVAEPPSLELPTTLMEPSTLNAPTPMVEDSETIDIVENDSSIFEDVDPVNVDDDEVDSKMNDHWLSDVNFILSNFLLSMNEHHFNEVSKTMIFKNLENLLRFVFGRFMSKGEVDVALKFSFDNLTSSYYRNKLLKVIILHLLSNSNMKIIRKCHHGTLYQLANFNTFQYWVRSNI